MNKATKPVLVAIVICLVFVLSMMALLPNYILVKQQGYWMKSYGGHLHDFSYSIQQTMDGGYITAGITFSFGTGNYDIWVLKLAKDGGIEWQKAYGSTGHDYAYSVQQISDGGYILSGDTDPSGTAEYDACILKLDGDGGVEWKKAYGSDGSEYAYCISPRV